MSTILSIRLDTYTMTRLEALANRTRRSKSFLAAEAIAFVEAESWQLDEIQRGLTDFDEGHAVPHKDVANRSARGVASVSGRHLTRDQSRP